MYIGVPKEIKNHEYRIGLTPAAVRELVNQGHRVAVEDNGGKAIGFDNAQYQAAGAEILPDAASIFAATDMIVKVKEPQPQECAMLREGQLLFTYLHLAADPGQAEALQASGATCIAYETITAADGSLPLLTPMSEVAGRMSIQAGAHHLEKAQGGNGMLLGGVPGVEPARVLIIGGGIVGTNAAHMAIGMGADVTILDRSIPRLRELDDLFGGRVKTLFSTGEAVEQQALQADLVIGAVLIPGAAAPKLISRDLVARMGAGSVLVDVAIDQGGCFETSRPTTHQDPTYIVDDVVHYCVANMPGGVARTSTMALGHATLPYVTRLAGMQSIQSLKEDPHMLAGLNVCAGAITHAAVAEALGKAYTDPAAALLQASPLQAA
ncbi:MAG: alanine dehydrogenase [Halieaceae bacterium]|jgi:alanine dehydrogenase|nr:alanine dehydrogenase [Halieaceae bacterium]